MAKKQDNTGRNLAIVAVLVAAYFLWPRKKKPVIIVDDLDEGEYIPVGPIPAITENVEIDFIKPYRNETNVSLSGCITC